MVAAEAKTLCNLVNLVYFVVIIFFYHEVHYVHIVAQFGPVRIQLIFPGTMTDKNLPFTAMQSIELFHFDLFRGYFCGCF